MKQCDQCYYYNVVNKWVNTPFKFGGTTLKGIDCFSVSLRVVQEAGFITSDQFNLIHSASTLRILRKEGHEAFKRYLSLICKGRIVETQSGTDLKCGDWAIRFIGKNFDVESALFVGKKFITSIPNLSVQLVSTFEFDFAISWGGFKFKEV